MLITLYGFAGFVGPREIAHFASLAVIRLVPAACLSSMMVDGDLADCDVSPLEVCLLKLAGVCR